MKQKPFFENDAGSVHLVSSKEFPISTTMTGIIEIVKPGAIRELHWHPMPTNGNTILPVRAA